MITDSRKAQRNSYAHHRAHLLFSGLPQGGSKLHTPSPALSGTDLTSLTQRVRAGLIGFVPTSATAQLDKGALANA